MVIKINYTSSDVYVSTSVSPVYVVVNYSAVNNGGGAVWGGITGTLSDQTDLQNALNAKVPYTGATQAVNLGAYDLLVQGLTIGKGNNALVNNTALGHSTLLTATTGNFNTAVGYESLRNTTTGQYNTAVGQSSLFSNTTGGQNTALGLNALLSNTTGGSNVAVGLDTLQHITTGSSNTAIGYNAGTHITGGSTPNTTATNSVFIGRDSKAGADGQTNQIVIGQNAVGNGSNTATFGNTSTTANYFTGSINGGSFVKSGGTSSQFLKADGSVDSSTYVGGSGATGQVAYWNGTNSQTGSSNLLWDNTNKRLGVGLITSGIWANYTSVLQVGQGFFVDYSPTPQFSIGSNVYYTGSNSLVLRTGGTGILEFTNNGDINLWNGVSQTAGQVLSGTIKMKLFSATGNLVLQNGGTFTDGGQRLQVMGSARIGTTAGSAMYWDDTNNRLGIGTSSPARALSVIGNISSSSGILAPSINSEGSTLSIGGSTVRTIMQATLPDGFAFNIENSGSGQTRTGGTLGSFSTTHTFAPTSGTSTYSGLNLANTINQTGGANGITRGLYVNPTLTAAADWRSIEWSNNSGWGLYGAGTANNYLGGDTYIGTTTTSATKLTIGGSETAASAIAKGVNLTSTLIASANNDVLVGLDVNPTFTNGAFTGVTNVSARFSTTNVNSANSVQLINTFSGGSNATNSLFLISDICNFGLLSFSSARSNSNANQYSTGASGLLDYQGNASLNLSSSFATGTNSGIRFWTASNTLNGTERMRLTAAGRLLLGTTTESTFLLDVNGTARVQGTITIGLGTNSGLRYDNSNRIYQDASFGWNIDSWDYTILTSISGSAYGGLLIRDATSGTKNTTAKLQIDSTTKGFLPPRMTTTQKNAIGTPAAGLVVYDTDTNKLCCYNGTSWNDLF
jgi:hypothetical protein